MSLAPWDRYALWPEDVGNGMTLNVNQADGNLYAEVRSTRCAPRSDG